MKKILTTMVAIIITIGMTACSSSDNNNNPVIKSLDSSSVQTGNKSRITISNFAFSPNDITVNSGTTVTWRNDDSVGHTVNFTLNGEEIKSGVLTTGGEFNFTFKNPGVIDYKCSIHPSMAGKITVK